STSTVICWIDLSTVMVTAASADPIQNALATTVAANTTLRGMIPGSRKATPAGLHTLYGGFRCIAEWPFAEIANDTNVITASEKTRPSHEGPVKPLLTMADHVQAGQVRIEGSRWMSSPWRPARAGRARAR